MKYHDMLIPDNVKKWNVKLLEVRSQVSLIFKIHRSRRHLDTTVRNQFWEDLESFILQPK